MSTLSDLTAEINAQLLNNTTQQITPQVVRTVLADIVTRVLSDVASAGAGGSPVTLSGTGDPGFTRVQHMATTYASPPNVIRTTGFAMPGDPGAGMYVKVTSQPDHDGWFQTEDGSYYELTPQNGEIWVEQLGTLKTTYDDTTVDSAPGINSAVDYAVFNRFGICHVRLGPGVFNLNSSVQLKGGAFDFKGMNTGWAGFGTGSGLTTTYVRPGKNVDGIVGHYNYSFEKTGNVYNSNTFYDVGDKVYMGNGTNDTSYVCIVSGTTGASSAPTGTGTGIIDGGVTWDFYRHVSRVERSGASYAGNISGLYMESHWYRWGGPTTDPWPYDTSTGKDYGGYCGIFLRTRAEVFNCMTTNFSGAGIVVSANGGVTYYKSRGNCNHWRVSRCASYFNGLDGLHVSGADANGGMSEYCDFSANARWAAAEFSFLGNKHSGHESAYDGEAGAAFFDGFAPHHYVTYGGRYWAARVPLLGIINSYDYSQAPGTTDAWVDIGQAYSGATGNMPNWVNTGSYEAGGTYGVINANCRARWSGCYVEGSDSRSQFGRFDWVTGNLLSNIVYDRCQNIQTDDSNKGQGRFLNVNGAINGFGNAWGVWVGATGELTSGGNWRGRNVLAFETDAFDFYSFGAGAGVGEVGWCRGGSTYPASYFMTLDYTTQKFGRVNSVGFGKHAFGQIFLGDGDAHNAVGVIMYNGALPPSDGREVARGEVFIRKDATPGAAAIVQCTTAGLAGSTAVFKTMSTLAA